MQPVATTQIRLKSLHVCLKSSTIHLTAFLVKCNLRKATYSTYILSTSTLITSKAPVEHHTDKDLVTEPLSKIFAKNVCSILQA